MGMSYGIGAGCPAGAENDPHAPWNETERGYDVDLGATATFYRTGRVYCKDAYWEVADDSLVLNTDSCDLRADFIAEGNMTIPQIFKEVTAILEDLAGRETDRADRYSHLISEIRKWEEGDLEFSIQ